MLSLFTHERQAGSVPIWPVSQTQAEAWITSQPDSSANWARANGFKGAAGEVLKFPNPDGGLAGVAFGLGDGSESLIWRSLASVLDDGAAFHIDAELDPPQADHAALAWALGCYRFDRYRKTGAGDDATGSRDHPRLALPAGVDGAAVSRVAEGVYLARDLINTPASDMGPQELADAAEQLAARHGAQVRLVVGDALLAENYPMIHAVGRASTRAPRLIDLSWGDAGAPKVTLVGKGIVFDTGGLDLKPSAGMLIMKKDMGGAANVLGLAHMIMDAGLAVRLRVLIPAAENSVSGDAYRPGDVLASRKGLSVEIGNTDAEGRLVLADALAEADSETPELLFDLATLTGAARVALGPDIPPFFTDHDVLASSLAVHARAQADPLWRLPLWRPYDKGLDGKIANISNVTDGGMAGAITAALFLKRFVTQTSAWAHIDIYGWNPKAGPGHPAGGEGQAIRAIYALLRERY